MKKWLLLGGCVLLILMVGLLYYTLFTFHVTGTTPDTKKFSHLSPFIDIHFNKELDENDLDLSVDQSPITGHSVVDKKTLRIGLDTLELDQEYTIQIYRITAKDGKVITNKFLRFNTKDIPFDKLSKSQSEQILKAQDTPNGPKADPILSFLPYSDLHFNLEPIVNSETVEIKAELLLSNADVKTDRTSAIEQYKKEVDDYLNSTKLDISKYNLQYVIIEPSIY